MCFFVFFICGCETREDRGGCLVIADLDEDVSATSGGLDDLISIKFTSRDSFKLIINCEKLLIPEGRSKVSISNHIIWNGGILYPTDSTLTFEGFNRVDDEDLLKFLKKENVTVVEFDETLQNHEFSEEQARKDVERVLGHD